MQGRKLKFTLKTTAVMLVTAMIITLLPTNGAGFWAKADDINKSVYIVDELKELRTENSKTYLKSDGSRSTVFSSSPMHYEDDGEWLEIDNTFQTVEKDGTEYYQNTAANMNVLLPEKLNETDGVTVENDGYSITVTPKDTDKAAKGKKDKARDKAKDDERKEMTATELAKEQVTTNGITYTDLYADTDVKYDVIPSGVKESIILNKKPNKHAKYTYTVTADELTAKLKNDGSIDFYYTSKNEKPVVFTMPAPYMFDSNGIYSYDIKVSLENVSSGEYELTYTPDYEWLKDKSRAYPVTVDPTITDVDCAADFAYTNSGISNSIYRENIVRIGSFPWPEETLSDYAAYIPSPDLSILGTNNIITSAKLHLSYVSSSWEPDDIGIGAYDITDENFQFYSFTYSSRPETAESPIDVQTVSQGDNLELDVTALAYNWYKNGGNYGVKLARADGGTTSTFYDYNNAYFEIDYNLVSGDNISNREISVGRAGTVYINDLTGHLSLIRNDIGVDGNLMPVNISMIYDIDDIYDDDGDMSSLANGVTSSAYGRGYRSSYSQRVTYIAPDNGEAYYKYIGKDGNEYYFDKTTAEDGTVTYEDSLGSGYTISVDTENPQDYTAVTIKDSAEQRYYFDNFGRIIKIVSSAEIAKDVTQSSAPADGKNYEAGVISITYVDNRYGYMPINTITDGVGRVYRFVYTDDSGMLIRIEYLGTGDTVLKSVNYTIDADGQADACIMSVTYADGKTVSYGYTGLTDAVNGSYKLNSITDCDGYKFLFDYNGLSVIRIREYAPNGTAGDDITVEYGYNETRYYKTADYLSGDIEIPYQAMQFDVDGNITSYFVADKDSNGLYKVSAQYKPAENSAAKKELVNLVYSDNQAEDLLDETNIYSGWNVDGENSLVSETAGINGERAVVLKGLMTAENEVTSTFAISGEKDEEYTLAFWAKSPMFAKTDARDFSATVKYYDADGQEIADTETNIEINGLVSNWQYITTVVTCSEDFSQISLTLNNDYRFFDAYFLDFALYHEAYAYNYHYTDSGELDYIEEISAPETEEETEEETDDETTEEEDTDPYSDETVSEMGIKSISKYDIFGNTIESLVTNGRVSIAEKSTYTENGNYLSSTTDSLGNTTSYNYNAELGTLDSVTDANGNETTYSYNAVGTVTGMSQDVSGLSNGDSLSVTYTYDNGGRVSTINHNNFDYTFSYDAFGVLTSVKAADTTLVSYTYDEDYMPATTVYGNEQTIYYTYDEKGQLIGISTKADEIDRVHFSYDTSGNLTMIYDSVNDRRTNFTYDADGNAVTTVRNLLNGVVKHEYKTVGDVFTETVDGNSYAMTYAYDLDGRLTTLSWSNGEATAKKEIHYDDLDRQTSAVISAKNGEETVQILNTSYVYNDTVNFSTSNQVSVLQNKANGYSSTIAYEYDKNGNIVKAGDVSYSYDEAGQLTRVNDPQYGTTVYVYDVGGNIKYVKSYDFTTGELGACTGTITYGYTAQWKDLLTSYNGQTITYDGAGNPLSYRDGMSCTWELGRQLASATHGGKTFTYSYDTDGLRTQKTDGTVTTDFYWADGQLSYQTDGTNEIYFRYDDSGEVIAFNLNGTDYYYVKNLQGDIIAILDGQGVCLVEYTYDAWGKLLNVEDNSDINLGTINPLRYRGYYYDTELELYYLQSRYYDPQVGRFLNGDDISYLGTTGTTLSHNLFVYCENNGINKYDIYGTYSIPAWIVSTTIDLTMAIMNPTVYGSFSLTTLTFKSFLKWHSTRSLAIRLIKGAVPAFKSVIKAGLTVVRTIMWRIAGVSLYYLQNYMVDRAFSKFQIWNYISIFSSYGSFFTFMLDVMSDSRYDNKIKLW